MVYAAKRAKNRCPTHPGALLRDDIIPATGRTKAEIAGLLAISRQHLYESCRKGSRCLRPSQYVSASFWRRCGNLDADAAAYDTWHAERSEDVSHIPTIKTKAA